MTETGDLQDIAKRAAVASRSRQLRVLASIRRRSERTVLYRAPAHNFQHVIHVFEERFRHTVYSFLDCGIFDQGVARVRSPECQHARPPVHPIACISGADGTE